VVDYSETIESLNARPNLRSGEVPDIELLNRAVASELAVGVDYLDRVGMANVTRHEAGLLSCGTAALQTVPGLRIIGTAREKAGVLSFVLDGVRTEEIGEYLNRDGIAIRAGHHCAQPIHRRFGL